MCHLRLDLAWNSDVKWLVDADAIDIVDMIDTVDRWKFEFKLTIASFYSAMHMPRGNRTCTCMEVRGQCSQCTFKLQITNMHQSVHIQAADHKHASM